MKHFYKEKLISAISLHMRILQTSEQSNNHPQCQPSCQVRLRAERGRPPPRRQTQRAAAAGPVLHFKVSPLVDTPQIFYVNHNSSLQIPSRRYFHGFVHACSGAIAAGCHSKAQRSVGNGDCKIERIRRENKSNIRAAAGRVQCPR